MGSRGHGLREPGHKRKEAGLSRKQYAKRKSWQYRAKKGCFFAHIIISSTLDCRIHKRAEGRYALQRATLRLALTSAG